MSSAESYSLREAAELLGMSKRSLMRRLQDGAFPGRFLAPGRQGLETRIPADEVKRALAELSERSSTSEASFLPRPYPALVRYQEPATLALTRADVDELRSTLLDVIREDRDELVSALRDALAQRDRQLDALQEQLRGIHGAVDGLRHRIEQWEQLPAIEMKTERPAPRDRDPELDDLLRELDEIEALVSAQSRSR